MKETSLSVDAERWKRVKVDAVERGIQLADAVDAGLRLWLEVLPEGVRRKGSGPKSWTQSKHAGVHDMLDTILLSGNKKAVDAVIQHIDTFYDYVQVTRAIEDASSATGEPGGIESAHTKDSKDAKEQPQTARRVKEAS